MAVICRLALEPLTSVPTFQMPVVLLYTPDGEALTNVSPCGSWSVTVTPLAVLGPELFTFKVNVTGWPTVRLGLLIVLLKDRSASCGVSVMLLWSSSPALLLLGVESGSRWSEAETWAVLVMAVVPTTVVVTCRMAVVLAGTLPTVQMPLALL